MKSLRKYGAAPYQVAVIHGGPGAPGEMAPVARELGAYWGVLEPLQTANTLDGQVEELQCILSTYAKLPVALVGYSWGAWLSFIVAARFPAMVRKLILVSSGPFEQKYARNILKDRLDRLGDNEKRELLVLIDSLNVNDSERGDFGMERLGQLISMADSYDPLPHDDEVLELQPQIFRSVWKEAEELRWSGGLLQLGKKIQCPVVAIHGAYDPHPAEGVEKPLSTVLEDFQFVLLTKCGHAPWIERHARDEFLTLLVDELKK
jgi:pimeloyl-ACP methyl ester carboxylesterase